MNTLQNFEKLAAAYSDNQADRLAYHLGMLESHIRSQDRTIAILEEEIRQMINQLNKELA